MSVETIELLAPGGSADAVKAAVCAGADAVYCGLPLFNARGRAQNISFEEFGDLVTLAHQNSCRIYLTLNTLILDHEFDEVVKIISGVYQQGIDGVIVQDWGLCSLLHDLFPALPIHASTQMTTHNAGQIELLHSMGGGRLNLCRELSLDEIGPLCAVARSHDMDVEVFVHGALCVSFSGQCYMSSVISGRSGNRGQCGQPCRRSYICSGQSKGEPFFSLKDNCAFTHPGDLADCGVRAFKIEGRMRNSGYVYSVVSAWRRQIDRYYATGSIDGDDPAFHSVFNRSLTCGYMDGKITKEMFAGSSADQSLVEVGRIRSYTADSGILKLEKEAEIDPETPVRIYSSGFTFVCTGFIDRRTGRHEYRLRITHKLKRKILTGDTLYRQATDAVASGLREKIDALTIKKEPLRIGFAGSAGGKLSGRFIAAGREVVVKSASDLVRAQRQPLDRELLMDKMGMLGTTPFGLAGIDCSAMGSGLFLPLRELNEMRRAAVSMLMPAKNDPLTVEIPQLRCAEPSGTAPALAILTDSADDLRMNLDPSTLKLLELPINIGSRFDEIVNLFRDCGNPIPFFPAILIGDHYNAAVELLCALRPKLIVTDNSGIGFAAGRDNIPWIAGPMLNCTNSRSLAALKRFANCRGAFISHELDCECTAKVRSPAGFSRWYTLFAPLLLMNSRQCLVRSCTECDKTNFDEACIAGCSRHAEITDEKKNRFHAVKRAGFYSQLYNGRHFFNPSVIRDVDRDNAVFFVDLRPVPSQTTMTAPRARFVETAERAVAGDGSAVDALRKMVSMTTAGQYIRGI